MLSCFQALLFLKVGKKSVLRSSTAHLNFAEAMIFHDLFSMTPKAPCSLSTPNRCNSESCLLHQHILTTPPQIRIVLFHKQSKVQLCKESIRPRFRTRGCCEMNLGLKEVSNSSWLTRSLHRLPWAKHSPGCLDLHCSQAPKPFLVHRG